MGMMHSTSGKSGYEPHYSPSSFVFEGDELLSRVLVRETELRNSDEIQARYSQNAVPYLEHIKDVTLGLQRQALRECGVGEHRVEEALRALHNVRVTHPHLLPLTVYGKFDTSLRGDLREGLEVLASFFVSSCAVLSFVFQGSRRENRSFERLGRATDGLQRAWQADGHHGCFHLMTSVSMCASYDSQPDSTVFG